MDRQVISSLLVACLISIAASGQHKESKPKAENREEKIACHTHCNSKRELIRIPVIANS